VEVLRAALMDGDRSHSQGINRRADRPRAGGQLRVAAVLSSAADDTLEFVPQIAV